MAGSAGTISADLYATMIERVRPGEPEQFILKTTPFVTRFIKPSEDVKVSARNYRIPYEDILGGTFGVVNREGGEYLPGTGTHTGSMQAAVKEFQFVGKLTARAKDQTDSPEIAVQKIWPKQFAKQMKQLGIYEDILWHNDGTGKYTAGAASVSTWASGSKTVYTFSKSTDGIGVNRLIEGMVVFVFDSDATTQLYNTTLGAAGVVYIEKIDRTTGEVFLSALINSATPGAGDFLAPYGVTALDSFNNYSGVPAVSPDTTVHGMYYWNDSNDSNYVDGVLKADLPQMKATAIDGTGTTYNALLCQNIQDKADERFGEDISTNWIAIMPKSQGYSLTEEQMQAMVVNNETVQENFDDRISAEMTGPRPKATICGVPHYTSFRQYRDRVDFINPSLLGKVSNVSGIQPLKVNGSTVWNTIGPNSRYAYAYESGWEMVFNWFNRFPGAGAYIHDLEVSATYKA